MENKNQPTSSLSPPSPPPPPPSPSFTAELFGDGDGDSQSSSTGIFTSIFPPASTVLSTNPNSSQFIGPVQKESSQSQVWTTTHGTSAENVAKNTASANNSIMNMERKSIFQERVDPSPLSSSIFYGGQEDMYVCSSSDPSSQSYSKFKKVDGKDDPNHVNSASRGNWWEGSLYY